MNNVIMKTTTRTHNNINVLVQVLAAGGELLRRRELEVPQLVLHSRTELVGIAFPLRVELDTDRCVLEN